MAQALRTAWNASRHWLATGLLASTILFLLLMLINWRNEHRGIASQKATGLTSVSVDSASAWHQKSILTWSSSERRVRSGLDSIGESAGGMTGGVLGGVPGSVRLAVNGSQPATPLENTERMVVRTGTLEIIVVDPVQAAEQLRDLATHLSGFVVSSRVSGSDERTRSAQVTVRIPAKYFDEARTQVRRIAKTVEQDTVEARDATREYVDQEARLRNARAEEAQYLAILKRAAMVKDVLEVSSKLAEVRGRIDESDADLRFLHHQVEMSLLTTNISAVPQAQAFGVHWRPVYEAKLSLRGALVGMAEYADAMVALFLNLPVVAIWGFTVVALLKVGWIVLRRIVLLFFPGLTTWLRRPVKVQEA
jgi:Domain of unknown function (DUF4349)